VGRWIALAMRSGLVRGQENNGRIVSVVGVETMEGDPENQRGQSRRQRRRLADPRTLDGDPLIGTRRIPVVGAESQSDDPGKLLDGSGGTWDRGGDD
jgi:hypothetical protein